MQTFESIITLVAGLFGLAIAFIPDWPIRDKALILIVIILTCVSIFYIRLIYKFKKLSELLEDSKQKHKALVDQFSKKVKLIAQYESSFRSFEVLLLMATQTNTRSKTSELYKAFLTMHNQIDDGGDSYAKDI